MKKILCTVVALLIVLLGLTGCVSSSSLDSEKNLSVNTVDLENSFEKEKYYTSDFISGVTVESFKGTNLEDYNVREAINFDVRFKNNSSDCFIINYIPKNKFAQLGECVYISPNYGYYIKTERVDINTEEGVQHGHDSGASGANVISVNYVSYVVLFSFEHTGLNPSPKYMGYGGNLRFNTHYVGKFYNINYGGFSPYSVVEQKSGDKFLITNINNTISVTDRYLDTQNQLDKGTYFYSSNLGGKFTAVKKNVDNRGSLILKYAGAKIWDATQQVASAVCPPVSILMKVGSNVYEFCGLLETVMNYRVQSVDTFEHNPHQYLFTHSPNKQDQITANTYNPRVSKAMTYQYLTGNNLTGLYANSHIDFYYNLNNQESVAEYKDDYYMTSNIYFDLYRANSNGKKEKQFSSFAPIKTVYKNTWNNVKFSQNNGVSNVTFNPNFGVYGQYIRPVITYPAGANTIKKVISVCAVCHKEYVGGNRSCNCSNPIYGGNTPSYSVIKAEKAPDNAYFNCPFCGAYRPNYASCCGRR